MLRESLASIGRLLAVCCAALIATLPVRADPPENYPFVAFDEGLRRAEAQSRKVFLYFGRYGCGWCDVTNKKAFSDPDVRRSYVNHYVLVYVDAESGKRLTLPNGERVTEMELGARFKAFATPMFVFLEPYGDVIFKIAGIQTAKDLKDYDRFVHEGIYKNKDIKQFISELQ